MPFLISGNLDLVDRHSLKKMEKFLGIILSPGQFPVEQYNLLRHALHRNLDPDTLIRKMNRQELLSFIYILTQFGDVVRTETPVEYLDIEKIPLVLEWQKGQYMIPYEVLDHLSTSRIFKNQNYLFALIPSLPAKEKKAWIEWIGSGYGKTFPREINHELYFQCRHLQKPFQGKSLLREETIQLSQLWPFGKNEIVDWFHKGITPFYTAMKELSRSEKDPFLLHVLDLIRSGKLILKKNPEEFRKKEEYILVATVEGNTPQLRDTVFSWEQERENKEDFLFQ
ncbi:hypothetical protein [Leptospira stimsonii]|uniref:Uncharacterized protein n=1 Tax=Leptospira stimsonii TaxID=2202203 RepID=A0A4R9L4C4_9LEPT|nr:hypothetical protein [Leptospira stimsonii]RHX85069.1 hypothetical protein DLM75_21535 [Leptospira stimsonii]RHX85377.1 hypothetical protein DLM78_14860 [Leptospira stimsonii]TGK15792.1 hypothetical protein EHO98_14295 [Leptospira stimsonii]TGM13610.1 hypothetical protein EHQ90_13705 [Leptospira stimsonii]